MFWSALSHFCSHRRIRGAPVCLPPIELQLSPLSNKLCNGAPQRRSTSVDPRGTLLRRRASCLELVNINERCIQHFFIKKKQTNTKKNEWLQREQSLEAVNSSKCQQRVCAWACVYIGADEWMFWELGSARSLHPGDSDALDTTRLSDQNTPSLQHKVRKELFSALPLSPVTSSYLRSLSARMSGAHLQRRTWQDQNRLGTASAKWVLWRWQTNQWICSFLPGCGYLPPIPFCLPLCWLSPWVVTEQQNQPIAGWIFTSPMYHLRKSSSRCRIIWWSHSNYRLLKGAFCSRQQLFFGFQTRLACRAEARAGVIAAGVWSAALGGGESWQVPEDKHKSVIIASHEKKGGARQWELSRQNEPLSGSQTCPPVPWYAGKHAQAKTKRNWRTKKFIEIFKKHPILYGGQRMGVQTCHHVA